jgi:UDP-N-acetylmuramoyl-tripeptide--D-alanyl-D-alanine ligase
MTLATAARVLKAPLQGGDAEFLAVCTDTRKLKRGDLYVALQGPRFDGHTFLPEAEKQGAVAALVSRIGVTKLPNVCVADTRLALGDLAAYWRREFSIPVIAVTGSNGKTTVKNMIAAILAETGPSLATHGNLNNDIGVPLTLLRLRAGDRYAVIEMGMNHFGEIDYLTRMTQPTIAVINNAGEAHLAGLGDVANVARAKGEIFAGLQDNGIAVINADDAYAGLWRTLSAPRPILTFGLQNRADISAEFVPDAVSSLLRLHTPAGDCALRLLLPGKHNVLNALAAVAAAEAAGVKLDDIKAGLEKLRNISGRLEMKPGCNGARVWDDTYNANPASVAAGIEVLRAAEGERVLVIGDMGELGEAALELHRRTGERARQAGIDRLFAVGELSQAAVQAFGENGRHFPDHEALAASLSNIMHPRMTVLVKGSRVMQMERVVTGIAAQNTPQRET